MVLPSLAPTKFMYSTGTATGFLLSSVFPGDGVADEVDIFGETLDDPLKHSSSMI